MPSSSSRLPLMILCQGTLVVLILLAGSGPLQGQCATGEIEIFGVSAGDDLGRSVAISGGRTFIGAVGDDDGGFLSGSVRIFQRNLSGYQLEEVLIGQAGSQLGSCLAADGNLLAAGASGAATVEIWRRDRLAWTQVQVLSDPQGQPGDGFGTALSLHGNLLAAGSPHFETAQGQVGCVTLWRFDSAVGWELQQRLLATDRVPGDQFGTAVSLADGSRLLIGAPGRDFLGPDTGAAFLFTGGLDGWVEEFDVGTGAATPGDRLGTSVAISGQHLLLGSPYSDIAGPDAGAVVNYHRVGEVWVLGSHLLPPSGASGCAFGAVLDLDGSLLTVGAPTDTGSEAFPAGSVSIYRWQGSWQLEDSLTGNPSSFLGSSIAVHRGVVISGAPFDSTLAPVGGNAILVVHGDEDCDLDGEPDSCSIAAGLVEDCDLDGVIDSCGISQGLSIDCDGDGIPDSCATLEGVVADCDGDGIPDSCAIDTGLVTDCDGDEIPDVCQTDCNQNLIPDACEIGQDGSLDCDGDGLLDACELEAGSESDCDSNGTIDSCDPDCNGDGTPDECEFLEGMAEDCNNNHIPDECDIAEANNDTNSNGLLDSCEPGFIRGEADGVEGIGIADAMLLIARVFGEVAIPDCPEAADANADGLLDISDGLYLLYYLFMGQSEPASPFPECGIIPIDAGFNCEMHPSCP